MNHWSHHWNYKWGSGLQLFKRPGWHVMVASTDRPWLPCQDTCTKQTSLWKRYYAGISSLPTWHGGTALKMATAFPQMIPTTTVDNVNPTWLLAAFMRCCHAKTRALTTVGLWHKWRQPKVEIRVTRHGCKYSDLPSQDTHHLNIKLTLRLPYNPTQKYLF